MKGATVEDRVPAPDKATEQVVHESHVIVGTECINCKYPPAMLAEVCVAEIIGPHMD